MSYLVLDTDVASHLFREFEGQKGQFYGFDDWDRCISFMTVAELRAGARMARWGIRKSGILENFIREFDIIHSDDAICSVWAGVRADARSIGREISAQDAWIAATAIALDAPLATNNRRDYDHIPGLELLPL